MDLVSLTYDEILRYLDKENIPKSVQTYEEFDDLVFGIKIRFKQNLINNVVPYMTKEQLADILQDVDLDELKEITKNKVVNALESLHGVYSTIIILYEKSGDMIYNILRKNIKIGEDENEKTN